MINAELVQKKAESLREELIGCRRHLHQYPELSFQESNTARYAAERLEETGIAFEPEVGGHGIIAEIVGKNGNDGPTVALRADMDALPIREENDTPYCSTVPRTMHACGHDAHTTCLLGAGRILQEVSELFQGTARLIFQPAEETAPGGALGMIQAGALQSPWVDCVIGQHVNTEIPVGSAGFRSGLFMASADEVYITVHGRGGHAAKPHQGVDPVAVSSQLIVALQQIVSRTADPIIPSVLSFGYILGDGSPNVIPDTVELAGTFRTTDEPWRDCALERIERTARSVVEALGGSAEVRIVRGYPPVVNDSSLTDLARERAISYLGDANVVDLPPALWAEDFAYYARERPGCFYNLGVRNEERGIVHPVHTPRFDLDEEALVIGSGLLAWIALGLLAER